jgi:hypothetical protein
MENETFVAMIGRFGLLFCECFGPVSSEHILVSFDGSKFYNNERKVS